MRLTADDLLLVDVLGAGAGAAAAFSKALTLDFVADDLLLLPPNIEDGLELVLGAGVGEEAAFSNALTLDWVVDARVLVPKVFFTGFD